MDNKQEHLIDRDRKKIAQSGWYMVYFTFPITTRINIFFALRGDRDILKYIYQEDKKKVVDVTSNFRAGALKGPPTPPTPQILPPLERKGYQSAPFQILHPSAYLPRYAIEVVQSYGAKTEIRTPMHT